VGFGKIRLLFENVLKGDNGAGKFSFLKQAEAFCKMGF